MNLLFKIKVVSKGYIKQAILGKVQSFLVKSLEKSSSADPVCNQSTHIFGIRKTTTDVRRREHPILQSLPRGAKRDQHGTLLLLIPRDLNLF